MNIAGRVALVTGGARRVGRAIATALAREKMDIAIHYNSSRAEALQLAKDLRAAFGVKAAPFQADLKNIRQIQRLVSGVSSDLGPVGLLVNSASLYERDSLQSTTPQSWDRHLNTNLKGPFFLCQAVVPVMKKSSGGHIINIVDWAAIRPYADYLPYCLSKAGLLALNTALAKELAPEIRVNAILPGPVLLPEGSSKAFLNAVLRATPLRRLGSPEDIAHAVVFLAKSDFITGAALPVDGGRLIA
jgi:NAD(P)-dependent dehydrogenase (short-subunit alcohol dehydrogenase family)